MSIRHFHKRDRINSKTRKAQQWPHACHLTAFSRVSFILGVVLDTLPTCLEIGLLLPLLTLLLSPILPVSFVGFSLTDGQSPNLIPQGSDVPSSHTLSKFSFCLITSAWTSNQGLPSLCNSWPSRRASCTFNCTSDISNACLVLSNSAHLKVNSASSPSAPSDWLH